MLNKDHEIILFYFCYYFFPISCVPPHTKPLETDFTVSWLAPSVRPCPFFKLPWWFSCHVILVCLTRVPKSWLRSKLGQLGSCNQAFKTGFLQEIQAQVRGPFLILFSQSTRSLTSNLRLYYARFINKNGLKQQRFIIYFFSITLT